MKLINIDSEKWTHGLYGIIIILFFSSFIMPIVSIYWFQDFFYHSKSHWIFIAPSSAYIIFFIGMILLPIAICLHLVIKSKFNWTWYGWITCLLFFCAIPFFYLGITNYYYLDEEGYHSNDLFSTQETVYRWDEMKELKEVWVTKNGRSTINQYLVITVDQKEIDLSQAFVSKYSVKHKVYKTLESLGVEVTTTMQDSDNE
ncbi:hypothetical protein [Pseudoneobacillus sp. C159]